MSQNELSHEEITELNEWLDSLDNANVPTNVEDFEVWLDEVSAEWGLD
jgi:hypothetical protein